MLSVDGSVGGTDSKGIIMGLVFNRRKRLGKNSWVNVSRKGVSASTKIGPLTLNSRGKSSIRLGKGISFKL